MCKAGRREREVEGQASPGEGGRVDGGGGVTFAIVFGYYGNGKALGYSERV